MGGDWHFAWVEEQMTEEVIEHDDGTWEWRDKIYATEEELQDALWSSESMSDNFGSMVDSAMNRKKEEEIK